MFRRVAVLERTPRSANPILFGAWQGHGEVIDEVGKATVFDLWRHGYRLRAGIGASVLRGPFEP